jgi:hypothetical protein
VLYCQINKTLVICIGTTQRCPGGDGHELHEAVKLRQHLICTALIEGQTRSYLGVGFKGAQAGSLKTNKSRTTLVSMTIISNAYFARAEPLTMSNLNKRHSSGPFHMGTRRDSFRRILLGSFKSGVSTQAVQPL